MNIKKSMLKNAQKLGREKQKTIKGSISLGERRCCAWDLQTGECTWWTCYECFCDN